MMLKNGHSATTPRWFSAVAWTCVLITLAHAVYVLLIRLDGPILDMHSFRQTQTALSAYWMTQGGPLLGYETPVVGSPWEIPFEFPLYQWLAAALARIGVPLDAAGRLVSFGFFIAAAWPLRMLWKESKLPLAGYPIACALVAAAPIYVFWSRTFMIESTAWFLGLLWLALFLMMLRLPSISYFAATTVVGSLAALVKVTTFPGFALLAGAFFIGAMWDALRRRAQRELILLPAMSAAAVMLPLAATLVWVGFSDALKMENPIGQLLTSGSLTGWNYGTIAQRLSQDFWWAMLWRRVLPDIFGTATLLALVFVLGALARRRDALVATAFLAAFMAPMLLFTNLHLVHNYYQYANAAFLLVAVAIALGALATLRWGAPLAAVALLAILAAQVVQFRTEHFRWVTFDPARDAAYQIALQARALVPPQGSLVVLSNDWSSTVAYYSQRRSMTLPGWTPHDLLQTLLANPQAHLAGTEFGGIMHCPGLPSDYAGGREALVQAFIAGRPVLAEHGPCRLLAPRRL